MPSPAIWLQPTTAEDLDFVLSLERNPDNVPFIGQWSRDRHSQSCRSQNECHWLIIERKTEERVGYVILLDVQNPDRSLHIKRVVIAQKGRGFGKAALQQVLQEAFGELQAHRVWLDVMEDNPRAYSLYRRLGFVTEGKLRECMKKPRGFISLWLMSMLRVEFFEKFSDED
ncbi:MAG: GNAT family N-acetyltransferase [Leptolyngbyaceae cyanobacterium]